jgi:hypothetical protein
VVDLQLRVAKGDLGFGLATFSGNPPAAGAFAGLGSAGRDGGLAEQAGQVPVAFLGLGTAVSLAGLIVQRGAARPGGQVPGCGEPAHVRTRFGEGVLGGTAAPAGHRLGLGQLLLIRDQQPLDHPSELGDLGVDPVDTLQHGG